MKRAIWLLIGMVTLYAAWLTRATDVIPGTFSRHMAVHMAVVGLAAPALTFAISGTRLDPVRALPQLFPPVPMSVVELVVVWVWHAPALHHFARHTVFGLALEQSSFLSSGLLVWLSAFGGDRGARHERRAAGIAALLLTSMHMTLLGALLALPPRPLYVHHGERGSLDALSDQHLGGAIMLLVGGAAYLFGGLYLTADLLRARRQGRQAARSVAPAPLGGTVRGP